jgi:hypothetical protein
VPPLRKGSHTVGISVTGQRVTVAVDGKTVLSATLPAGTIPASVLPAFTASTGSRTDQHTVTSAAITAGGSLVPPPGGGWSYNGSAALSGSDTVLTTAAAGETGSVVYPRAVTTRGLRATFDAQLGGGTGAAGLTFVLLNPARSRAVSLGGGGAQLGSGGLDGVAVTLVTNRYAGYPAANFVAISRRASGGSLRFQAVAQAIGPLRSGTHTVTVEVRNSGGADVLIVLLDGQQVLQSAAPSLTRTSMLAFTAAAGTDVHTVRDIAVSAAG